MAGLWEEYDLVDDPQVDIPRARPEMDEKWYRPYVARFKLANGRWPRTSEVIAAWDSRADAC